ncbi:hypothetical protein ACA910_012114 [Epithemia clementina (nom. ined.)]
MKIQEREKESPPPRHRTAVASERQSRREQHGIRIKSKWTDHGQAPKRGMVWFFRHERFAVKVPKGIIP